MLTGLAFTRPASALRYPKESQRNRRLTLDDALDQQPQALHGRWLEPIQLRVSDRRATRQLSEVTVARLPFEPVALHRLSDLDVLLETRDRHRESGWESQQKLGGPVARRPAVNDIAAVLIAERRREPLTHPREPLDV